MGSLIISNCYVDKEDVKKLQNMQALQALELADNPKINDGAVLSIPSTVRDIDLRGCPVTGKSLKNLIAMKNLQIIRLNGTNWSGSQIAELRSHKKQVTVYDARLGQREH